MPAWPLRPLGAALALLTIAAPRAMAAQDYLPIDEAVALLADSRPWAVSAPDGMRAKLTLRPDGSGVFDGPITMKVTWRPSGQDLCIRIGAIGNKCLRFVRAGDAIQAYADGKPDLSLLRP